MTVEDVEDGNLVVVKNVVQIADLNDNPVEFSNKVRLTIVYCLFMPLEDALCVCRITVIM